MILAPNEMKVEPDERKATKICLETIKLDADLYRIGHTKARKSDPPLPSTQLCFYHHSYGGKEVSFSINNSSIDGRTCGAVSPI